MGRGRSNLIEEADYIIVLPAVLIAGRPGKSVLPGERTIQSKASNEPIHPAGGVLSKHLPLAEWQIVIPREHKNMGAVVIARTVTNTRVDEEIIGFMCQGLGPSVMGQEL